MPRNIYFTNLLYTYFSRKHLNSKLVIITSIKVEISQFFKNNVETSNYGSESAQNNYTPGNYVINCFTPHWNLNVVLK